MRTEVTLVAPKIHTNGTHPEALVGALVGACNALEAALDALRETAPHARDYSPEAFTRARHQHEDRVRAVEKVKNQLEDLVGRIDAQTAGLTIMGLTSP